MSSAPLADLISTIAHELRSPLTSVKGFSAMLLKRWDRFTDEQRLEFIESILSDAERMGRIITEVLDLARLESGRFEINTTPVEVEAAVTRALGGLDGKPGHERVDVEVEPGLVIDADAERFERVVAQLIENAMKFSQDGPIEVRAQSENGSVRLSVKDEGAGIPAERLPELFDAPGPRGGVATPSGSGLGLLIAKRIVEAHGGALRAESALGKGSTFTLEMPAGGRQ